jgi:prepilin-type processing-associated H-X9-DG protein
VGRFEPPGRYDICAAYGAPASVRHEAGGREAWSYGPGTFVFNYKGIIRRFHGRHPAGTVTFVDGHVVAVEFGRHPSPAP